MNESDNNTNWLTSNEALKVDSCDLMHIRLQGKLRFEKERNAFMYSREMLNKLEMKRKSRVERAIVECPSRGPNRLAHGCSSRSWPSSEVGEAIRERGAVK